MAEINLLRMTLIWLLHGGKKKEGEGAPDLIGWW